MTPAFNLCIVLPTYNNVSTIEQMVTALREYSYPMVVVNDGSGPEMNNILSKLAEMENIHVLHRAKNGGKGAAVMDGIRWAHDNGFSHALQMDADCQHRVSDLPKFVEAARIAPRALVLGKPIFPPNTPKSRLNGRKISVVWVWITTLSKKIQDPLFGYRIYPIANMLRAFNTPFIGKRMDFDPEIAVRLVWRGTDVVTIDTPVTYPPDGVSHFHYFFDNVRISWMHTRLFLGMILRSWILIGRRIMK